MTTGLGNERPYMRSTETGTAHCTTARRREADSRSLKRMVKFALPSDESLPASLQNRTAQQRGHEREHHVNEAQQRH